MNYNNLYNPYNIYGGYGNYPQPMAQPQYQMPQYQTQNNVAQTPQTTSNFQPTFVNGVEGARAYILFPNQVMYLKDSDNENIMYIKKADSEGKCTLNAYKMEEINLENVGKCQINSNKENSKIEYLTKNDFNAFLGTFDLRMNNLSSLVEKSLERPARYQKRDYKDKE